ncbi:competence/damage-inducible protein A [Halocatena pleomorpha]|uniref:Competence/damage-inducible protein A n=1 Tax=Halocatena pleomorpha TaxID=1785090 RepID=A0A3P3RIX0_9EURY|nr:molybdopterin-binding protein [Halocatena pleomorpha]RRJ32363.1 competence/damage-inducible protein A [Halocatena pleomorpha]
MDVALLTVGDELLSGDTENTNATWLASELSARGVAVKRILVVPDESDVITAFVRSFSDSFDAVIVTGGLGQTPDDVTMESVARAFEQPLEPNELAQTDIEQTVAEFERSNPDLDIDVDIEDEAALPAGARALVNEPGLSPGCVMENVYVLPGIPKEMQAMFASIAAEFSGTIRRRTLYTTDPESRLIETLTDARDQFDVSVGCYPDNQAGHNRLQLTGTDANELDRAAEWFQAHVTIDTDRE